MTKEKLEEQIEKMKSGENCIHSFYTYTEGYWELFCKLSATKCSNCKDKWRGVC